VVPLSEFYAFISLFCRKPSSGFSGSFYLLDSRQVSFPRVKLVYWYATDESLYFFQVFSQKMNDVINSTVATRTNESQVYILTEYSSGTSKRIGISLINNLYKPKLTEDPEDRLVLLDSWIKKKTQVIIRLAKLFYLSCVG
jgi:hypothetical protein